MSSLAQAALGASIVLSAIGAVVLGLITVAYGFTRPSHEASERTAGRLFLTRTTHQLFLTRTAQALAATCFAGTAILIAVALAQPTRTGASADGGPSLASRLDTLSEQLQGVERRINDSETTMQRLESNRSAVADAQRAAVELMPPAGSPRTAKAATSGPSPAKMVERKAPAVGPAERRGTAELRVSTRYERPRAAAPASAPLRPRDTAEKPASDSASRLREDWRAIQRGVESGADDLRRAVERLRRGGN